MESLDATADLVANVDRARTFGRTHLLVVVSASHCPGCATLAHQLDEPPVRQAIGNQGYLVRIHAGDLWDEVARSLRIGAWVLRSPGFPTTWVWTLDDGGLSFCSLALGPLSDRQPEADIAELLAGRSCWVPEAAGMSVEAKRGKEVLALNADNQFSAAFLIDLDHP